MTEPRTEPGPAQASNRGWPIAFAVVVALLIAAVLFIVLRSGGDDETTGTTGTTGTTATSGTTTPTTSDSGPSSSASDAVDLVCTAADLFAAIDPSVLAQGSQVTEFGCTPASTGDAADAYAWARLETPNLEPLIVFYEGDAGDDAGTPVVVDWQQLAAGTSVVCEDHIPVAACDMLPGAPRLNGPSAPASTTASTTPDRAYDLECTAADLTAAVEPGVLADGAQVTAFGCTPSSLENADAAYAFARFEAPDVGSIVVLYSAVAAVEPGTTTVVDWQAVAWGSAVVCDEHLPVDACDALAGVPRG